MTDKMHPELHAALGALNVAGLIVYARRDCGLPSPATRCIGPHQA